jgi:sec-independent protein translocase protein TatC
MTFVEHLEELRWHLIRSVISIFIFGVVAFLAKEFVFHHLILGPSRPDFWTYRMMCKLGEMLNSSVLCIGEQQLFLQSRQMTGQFTMHITASLVIGIICAFPYTFWELWRFISPGLMPNERRVTQGATFSVTILFVAGILFGYYIVSPLSINFLSNYQVDPSIHNEFDIISYVSTLCMLVLTCGLMFQLPIIVYFLSQAGFITPGIMKTYRRHALVVILVVSAILTPPDVISQLLIAMPLVVLYQVSIYISAFVISKRERKRRKELLLKNNLAS